MKFYPRHQRVARQAPVKGREHLLASYGVAPCRVCPACKK